MFQMKIVPNTDMGRVSVSSHTHMIIYNDVGWNDFLCKYFSLRELALKF